MFQRVPRADADPPLPARAAQTYRGAMLRMLALIVAAIVVVLVAMAVVKTFIWLAMIALIFAAVCLAFGVFRLGRRSSHRSGTRL